jgi:hypothetical protein
MFASTRCPVKTSPSFASNPTGPLCHACPAWRWGRTCFADGDELYDAIGVRCARHRLPQNEREDAESHSYSGFGSCSLSLSHVFVACANCVRITWGWS